MKGSRRDYYEVLGVPRDADAATLKRAYRELAMRHHPDQNPGDPMAEAAFKEVSAAYTVLSDPEARARYDRRGFDSTEGGVDLGAFTSLFENLFGDLFGKKKAQPKDSGRNLRYTLELEFAEAALGTKKTIHFPRRHECDRCRGTGAKDGEKGLRNCTVCGGRGELKVQQGFFTLSKRCASCDGQGRLIGEQCEVCRGEGMQEGEAEFEVAIPPGTENGATRRVAGQGEPGRHGGAPGDLNVLVRVRPHPIFRREGDVVVCEVPISVGQAALGGVIEVPTLEGQVEMRVPQGTQSGALFRLREKGMTFPGRRRGDAHVRLIVETPTQLTERQQQIFIELSNSLTEAQEPTRGAFLKQLRTLPKEGAP